MCTSYTARYICILSLQYIWISSGLSRCLVPTLRLTSEYPTCSVCACAYPLTHTHNTYTSTPSKKRGDTSLAQHWKQMPIVHQLEKPRSPLSYIRMQWCLKHLGIAPKTPVEHTYARRRCDSWSLSHLGYLYPGTTPVMIKVDHNRSCPWV